MSVSLWGRIFKQNPYLEKLGKSLPQTALSLRFRSKEWITSTSYTKYIHNMVSKNRYHLTCIQWSMRNVLEGIIPPYSIIINQLSDNICKQDDDSISMGKYFPRATAQEKAISLGGMWNIWIFKSCHFLSSGNIPQDRFLTRELSGVIWKERWKKTYKDFILDLYKLSPPAIRFNISPLFNWFGKFKANIKWNLIRGPLWECPLKKSLPTIQTRYSTEKQRRAQLKGEKHLSHGIAKVRFLLNQQNCFYIPNHLKNGQKHTTCSAFLRLSIFLSFDIIELVCSYLAVLAVLGHDDL